MLQQLSVRQIPTDMVLWPDITNISDDINSHACITHVYQQTYHISMRRHNIIINHITYGLYVLGIYNIFIWALYVSLIIIDSYNAYVYIICIKIMYKSVI